MSMRANIIFLPLLSIVNCRSNFDNRFESINFPLGSDKNPRVVEEVNKKGVKNIEVIYEEEYPMEDVGFKGGEKVECNLSKLNIVIQANLLTDITKDNWRLMLNK